jgi:hypothetical protein
MVSARPAPKVIGGRTAYPSAQTYTPGDVGEQPETTSPTSPSKSAVPTFQPGSPSKGMTGGGGIERVMSNESDKAGLMTWFKGFRDRSSSEPQRMGKSGSADMVIHDGANDRYTLCLWSTTE